MSIYEIKSELDGAVRKEFNEFFENFKAIYNLYFWAIIFILFSLLFFDFIELSIVLQSNDNLQYELGFIGPIIVIVIVIGGVLFTLSTMNWRKKRHEYMLIMRRLNAGLYGKIPNFQINDRYKPAILYILKNKKKIEYSENFPVRHSVSLSCMGSVVFDFAVIVIGSYCRISNIITTLKLDDIVALFGLILSINISTISLLFNE